MSDDGQIKSFFQRWENLEAEKKQTAEALRDLFGEAKGFGYNTKALRAAFNLKVKQDLDSPKDAEFEATVDIYMSALNAPAVQARDARVRTRENIEEFDPITGEFVDENAVPSREQSRGNGSRDHQHAHSRQTDGAKHGGQDGMPAGADHAYNQPETANEMDREEMRGGRAVHSLPAENARKAVPETEDGSVTHAGAGEIPATFSEIDPTEDRSEGHSLGGEKSSVGANVGGDHVTAQSSAATHQAGASFKAPPAKPLRPHCLRPENCGGYGSTHCFSCKKAAKTEEVAA